MWHLCNTEILSNEGFYYASFLPTLLTRKYLRFPPQATWVPVVNLCNIRNDLICVEQDVYSLTLDQLL